MQSRPNGGYAISGNRIFVEKFDAGIDSIRAVYKQIQQLENRNEFDTDAELFLKSDSLVTKKIVFMQRVKSLCDNDDCKAAAALIATNEGQHLSDSITLINKQISVNILEQLKKSQTGFLKINSKNNKLAYTGIVASMLLIVLVFYFLQIEIRRKKRVTDELSVHKEHFKVTLNSIGEGLITTDKMGHVVYMNPAAEKLTGWSWKEAKKQPLQNVYNVVNEETGRPFENIVSRIIKNGKIIELENNSILKAKNTGRFIISNTGAPLLDLAGNISGSVVVFNDITERKKIEKQLKDSEEKYRSLFEQASDAILIYSFDGTIHEFNKSCYTILGYTAAEYAKLRVTDILVDEIIINQDNYAAILAGETKTLYRHLMRKDGSLLESEVTVKMLEDGKVVAFARDITERKKAENEIKKSNERFSIIGQATNDAIWEWNLATNELWGNEMHQHLYGLTLADPVPPDDEWKRRLHIDDKERIIKSIEKTLASKRNTWDGEYRMQTENKGEVYIYGQTYIERNKEGRPIRMIGSMMDITQRKKAEETIKKEKELSDSIINSLPGVFYFYDENLKLLRWNKQLENVTGYSATELSVMNPAEFFKGEDRKYMEERSRKVFAEGKGDAEASFTTKTGKKIPFYFTGLRMQYEGKPSLLGIGIDITERKDAETKTKAAIERYDILARATSDTIWDWDIVNSKMLYNDGMYKMFGYDASEVENVVDWWNEKLHPEDFKKVTELLADVFENGFQNFQTTYRFRCANNTFKYIYDRAFVIFDDTGNATRMIGAMQDISNEVEEEIRVAKAIIDAQEEERRFIGAELHDNINQILAGSLLYIGMVKSNQVDTKKTFEFIEAGKGYITDAINEVRKLSHELMPASFDDNTLKDSFENLLLILNLSNRFNIQFDFDELCNQLNREIQINLYRIMQEQTKNIMKYSEANAIEISVTLLEEVVKMRIFDNGKGFNTKTIKKGIGLSNIKRRAESLSGKYLLNSAAGKGCEIIVEIPLNKIIES